MRRSDQILISVCFIISTFLVLSCSGEKVESGDTDLAPSDTGVVQLPTPFPTVTNTPASELVIASQTHCLKDVSEQLQKNISEMGTIIFEGECEGKKGLFKLSDDYQKVTPFLADISYGKSFVGSFITPFYVSKDHQWLMYEYRYYDANDTYLGKFLFVTGENENSLIQYPVNGNWYSLMGWNNGLISYSALRAPDFTINLLDPLSGKVTQYYYPHKWFLRDEIFFDPSIARVLYFDDINTKRYLLKEIATDKLLWQSTEDIMTSNFAGQPQWSPDGLFFAVPIWDKTTSERFKFLIVDREGKELNLPELFPTVANWHYVPFDWSTSGKYLSFWVEGENGDKKLMIWDVGKKQFIDSSITAKASYPLIFPVFSPNEQQFILDVHQSDGVRLNYLFDMNSHQIVKLDLNLSPIAWLKPFESVQSITKPVDEPDCLPPKNDHKVEQQHLIEGSNELPSAYTGGIVYSQNRFLYTLMPNERENGYLIDKHQLMDAFVSPNRSSLFYWYEDENDNFTPHYFLTSLNGQKKEVITDNIIPSYDAITGWFNNQELWTQTKDASDTLLFNPFNNTFRNPPKFKDPQMAGCTDWLICSHADRSFIDLVDAKFERKIFTTASSVYMMDQDANFLWQYENWLVTLNLPKWLPDEQSFSVPIPIDDAGEHYEFLVVNRDGKSEKITDYSSAYPTLLVDKFQWSPDGKFIAFWADTHSQTGIAQRNPYRLFVLNTTTRQTIDYCVTGKYSDNKAPIWSPDGNHIAVNSVQDGKELIFLLDLKTGAVSPLVEGELVGWLRTP